MAVDFVALAPHYIDHLAPVYEALSASERGCFHTSRGLRAYATQRRVFARGCGNRRRLIDKLRAGRGPIVTAGYGDLRLANASGRPQIFFNHGAGFRYSGDFPGYCGSSAGRDRVTLFLEPSETSAAWSRRACPGASAVAVGCPKLDAWHVRAREGWIKPRGRVPTIAVSFHHDAGPVPEMRSAFPHYRESLGALAREMNVVGHAHPKWGSALRPLFDRFGIRYEPTFERVLEIADVYACDTSSTIYEFASTDRPVVLLNAPWYRRSWIHPGNPRFWEHADVGLQCDEPGDLVEVIRAALEDPEPVGARRREAVRAVYAAIDGTAAERAAEAIRSHVSGSVSTTVRRPATADSANSRQEPRPWGSSKTEVRPSRPASFGVVITNRDRAWGMENCLGSLAHQTVLPSWVVIADLGSRPEAQCALSWQAERFGISYLRIDYRGRWNKALAFNTALRAMPDVDYVIQLDADMIVAHDLLEYSNQALGSHRAIAYLPRFASRESVRQAGERPWLDFRRLVVGARPSQSAWAIGGCMILPREWLTENRGMDEAYSGWGMEDSDLWWRATTELPGQVEQSDCRLIHQWHPREVRSQPAFARNKERFYRRLLGHRVPTNPQGWGRGTVGRLDLRLGMFVTPQAGPWSSIVHAVDEPGQDPNPVERS